MDDTSKVPEIDLVAVGRRLGAVRTLRGYRQGEAAAAIGVSQASFSDYELGKAMMGLDKLNAITRAFDVSADWLLGLPGGEGRGPF